jgi:hypothetical protein
MPQAAGRWGWCETGDRIGCRWPGAASICWSTRPNWGAVAPLAKAGPRPAPATRGYARLYQQEILDADEGCDFAFLRP